MTDVGEDRPKSASVLKKGSLARGSMKPKKGSLKPRKSSKTRKKSRSSSRSSRVSRPSNRPSSAPSLRGSVRSSKSKKSWTFPPLGGKPISRVDFAGSMKPVWSQSPEVETFYSRKSNVEKRPLKGLEFFRERPVIFFISLDGILYS
ncbi:Protein of unknown function [Gryllus bimaculatus]|nr:Protein of unknown function [Gryllus bimaculatus]